MFVSFEAGIQVRPGVATPESEVPCDVDWENTTPPTLNVISSFYIPSHPPLSRL